MRRKPMPLNVARSRRRDWFSAFSILLAVWVFSPPLWAAGPAADRAENGGGLSVTIGPARIKLLEPPGLMPIDGLDPRVDELLAELKAPGAEILAVYAEPRSWSEYRKGVNREGPRASLDFYAYIATPSWPPEETIGRDDFERFKELTRSYGGEMRILGEEPRYMTYRLSSVAVNEEGRSVRLDQITTLMLVEGKILTLNVFSNDLNRVPSQFMPSALGWRDAYWRETRP